MTQSTATSPAETRAPRRNPLWQPLLTLIAIFGVLGFYQALAQDPRSTNQPFANAVEQRLEMINQLKELNAQLKEQNTLLRSGQLQVVISDAASKRP